MRPHAASAVALLALLPLAATAAAMPDLARLLDHPPRKEPAYTSKRPLYGLAAFGPKADKAVWMVLDQSRPGAVYDVLYIDRDADGDLTGPGERLTAQDGELRLGDFTDPATGAKHTDCAIRVSGDGPDVLLRLRWRGGFRFGGGYPEVPDGGYMRFAARPADAPVLWVWGDDPFRFQRWYGAKLPIGAADDFKVFLGQPGRGRHTFCAAQEHILPDKEFVRATLLYRDGMGREKRLVCELKERC